MSRITIYYARLVNNFIQSNGFRRNCVICIQSLKKKGYFAKKVLNA